MELIGSISNQGTLQGQINDANGYLTGVITNAGLLGGQVIAERGLKGDKGETGQDGHSPVVTASKVGKVTTVSVDGSAIATINDGNDGQDGSDGQDGADGQDGYSPSASVTKSGSVATISITDKNGTTTASVSDGSGIPIGGTSGQILTKHSATDYDVSWEDPSGGTITDVEVDGTSVVTAGVAEIDLTGKANVSHTHTKSQITDFPTIPTITDTYSGTSSNGMSGKAVKSAIDALHDVPSGGTSGQVLSKDSNDDYDLAWTTVSGGSDVVYATSSDSASTVAKTATIVSGTLTTLTSGVQAIVKFANTNTASSPTLNIGSTGAKSIKRYGTTAVGQNQNESWVAGSPVLFVYDGTNWVIAGWLNTTYSGGTASGITTGTDNLNYIWSPKQIHDGIDGMATATPTASKTSKFDSNAKMNSTDMSSAEVSAFVSGLNVSGASILDMFYPVGSYYETSDGAFDPNVAWGGTWSLETAGQVHVSAGTGYTLGATGGEATHTLTINEMPSHNHPNSTSNTDYNSWQSGGDDTLYYTAHTSFGRKLSEWIAYQGGGQAHNNMQPYIVVNRWHRTA